MTEPDRKAAYHALERAHRAHYATTPTPRQKAVLDFIGAHTLEKGVPPTIREICGAFGLSSTNAVYDMLKALRHKGLLEARPTCASGSGIGVARGLRLVQPTKPAGVTELAIRMPDAWVGTLEAAAASCGLEVEEMARRALRGGLSFAVAETKGDQE